jgi:hypothetical protein
MITWTDVSAIAPELATVPTAAQEAILDMVEEQTVSAIWGNRLETGQRYLAAHLASLRGGPNFQQETVGDHTRQVSGDLDSTSYGREYRRLLRSLGVSMAVVGI